MKKSLSDRQAEMRSRQPKYPSVIIKHGHARVGKMSRTYKSWQKMLARCYNPNSARYKNYGAKGVSVCDKWRDFSNFLADMGERPKGKTVDRWPDKRGNYEPGNCRWATCAEQGQNTSRTKLTPETVKDIRSRALAGEHYLDIARDMMQDRRTIRDVVLGITWINILPEPEC